MFCCYWYEINWTEYKPNKYVWIVLKLKHKCRAISWCFSNSKNTFYRYSVIIQIKQKWNNMSKRNELASRAHSTTKSMVRLAIVTTTIEMLYLFIYHFYCFRLLFFFSKYGLSFRQFSRLRRVWKLTLVSSFPLCIPKIHCPTFTNIGDNTYIARIMCYACLYNIYSVVRMKKKT